MNSLNKARLGPLWPGSSLSAAHPSVFVHARHAPNQRLGKSLSPAVHLQQPQNAMTEHSMPRILLFIFIIPCKSKRPERVRVIAENNISIQNRWCKVVLYFLQPLIRQVFYFCQVNYDDLHWLARHVWVAAIFLFPPAQGLHVPVAIGQPWETCVTGGPGKVFTASRALPLAARAAVIIISPAGTIWKGYFHLLKGLWACFLLALKGKKKKKTQRECNIRDLAWRKIPRSNNAL